MIGTSKRKGMQRLTNTQQNNSFPDKERPQLLRRYQYKNGYPVIPWTDIQGNKFMPSLHPAMLSDEGHHVFKQARISGQSQHEERIQCFVYYNRDFVIQKLGGQLLDLKGAGFNEIQKVIGEAWRFCKEIEEDDDF